MHTPRRSKDNDATPPRRAVDVGQEEKNLSYCWGTFIDREFTDLIFAEKERGVDSGGSGEGINRFVIQMGALGLELGR